LRSQGLRKKCSTIAIRKNGLTDMITAGNSVSSVSRITICIGELSVRPLDAPGPKTGMDDRTSRH